MRFSMGIITPSNQDEPRSYGNEELTLHSQSSRTKAPPPNAVFSDVQPLNKECHQHILGPTNLDINTIYNELGIKPDSILMLLSFK